MVRRKGTPPYSSPVRKQQGGRGCLATPGLQVSSNQNVSPEVTLKVHTENPRRNERKLRFNSTHSTYGKDEWGNRKVYLS